MENLQVKFSLKILIEKPRLGICRLKQGTGTCFLGIGLSFGWINALVKFCFIKKLRNIFFIRIVDLRDWATSKRILESHPDFFYGGTNLKFVEIVSAMTLSRDAIIDGFQTHTNLVFQKSTNFFNLLQIIQLSSCSNAIELVN